MLMAATHSPQIGVTTLQTTLFDALSGLEEEDLNRLLLSLSYLCSFKVGYMLLKHGWE